MRLPIQPMAQSDHHRKGINIHAIAIVRPRASHRALPHCQQTEAEQGITTEDRPNMQPHPPLVRPDIDAEQKCQHPPVKANSGTQNNSCSPSSPEPPTADSTFGG